MTQFFCRHCGELIRMEGGVIGCPKGCADPFPKFPLCVQDFLSDHFTGAQLMCPCCGACDLDKRLLPALEKLHRLAGANIEIVSGYRCENFNAGARGVSKMAHMQGRAVDIRIPGKTLQEMYDLAEQVHDFAEGGIGVHDDGSLHVDARVFRARWGRLKGVYVGIESSKLLGRW